MAGGGAHHAAEVGGENELGRGQKQQSMAGLNWPQWRLCVCMPGRVCLRKQRASHSTRQQTPTLTARHAGREGCQRPSRSHPARRVNLSDMLELDDDVIDWLCGVTLEELELSPSHYTIDLMRHRPAFIARSGRALRRLLGAQVGPAAGSSLQ